MTEGPQRARLDSAVDTASATGVTGASEEWRRCATLLAEVAKALDGAAATDVRGNTGTSMKDAFTHSAGSVRKKIERLDAGRRALTDAHAAIARARQDRVALDADAPGMSDPGTFRPDPEKTPEENQTARGLHQGAVNDYWDRYAKREAEARRIADVLDTRYADSVAVMKQIHGEPDRTRTDHTERTDRGTERGTERGTAPAPVEPGPAVRPPGSIDPGHPPGPVDPSAPSDPAAGGHLPGGLTTGGLTTGGLAVGGGLAGFGLANAIRGGLAGPGQAVRPGPVRPIGSTSRAAVSGTLGRSGAAGTGSPGSARTTSGRGVGGSRGAVGRGVGGAAQAGTRGTPQGSARGSGTRGAGAGATGGRRGGANDDEERRSDRDLFDDGQDWVDDEGAASGVLD